MKTHRFDPLSFITGTLAVLLGLAYLIPAQPADIFDVIRDLGAWFWPVVLVLVGVAILAPLASRATSGDGPAIKPTEDGGSDAET